jgi:cytochrome c biogenesis protein CcmG/thiol:disulfide interchange protein DsbE
MTGRWLYFIPLILLGVLVIYFFAGLGRDTETLESVLINQKVPSFFLSAIEGESRGLSSADLQGKVVLVNIFGSWCVSCLTEHPLLMSLKEKKVIPIYGIDWRELDQTSGPRWLKKYGNPYTLIGNDPNSRGAIAFGVTKAPETFIVDEKGVIRFKHLGPITQQDWDQIFTPILEKLRKK